MTGKIIVVTGGPRTGKSTLVRLLSEKLNGIPFLEGEEKDFPERILNNIQTGNNILELLIWFRNKGVSDYLKAMKVKEDGGTAILDTFWATNDVYAEEWIIDDFKKKLIMDMAKIDHEVLPWPDVVLALSSNETKIKEFSVRGGREFELTEEFLQKQVSLNNAHEEYFKGLNKQNIRFINRSELDYLNEDHLNILISEL